MFNRPGNTSRVTNSFWDSVFERNRIILLSFSLLLFFSIFGTNLPWQVKSADYYETEASNPVNQILYTFLFLTAVIVIIQNYNRIFSFIKKEKYLSIFIVFCLLSAIWSDYTLISIKRSFQLFVTFLVILISITFIEHQKLIKIIRVIISAYVLVTILSVMLVPQAIDTAFHSWRGLEYQKNGLGAAAYLCLLLSLQFHEISKSQKSKIWNYLILALSILMIIRSTSTTAAIVLLLIAGISIITGIEKIFKKLRIRRFILLTIVFFLVGMAIVMSIYAEELFANFASGFGKDLTFTGRTVFWAYMWQQFQDHILFGFGYATYWVMGSPQVNALFNAMDIEVNTSHNGFIDLALQLGLVGMSSLLFLILTFLKRSLSTYNNLALITIISIIVANFTESSIFTARGITNFVFIYFYLTVSKTYFKID